MAYHPDTPTPLAAVGARFADGVHGRLLNETCHRPELHPPALAPLQLADRQPHQQQPRAQHHTQQRTHQSGPHRTYYYGERVGWPWLFVNFLRTICGLDRATSVSRPSCRVRRWPGPRRQQPRQRTRPMRTLKRDVERRKGSPNAPGLRARPSGADGTRGDADA